MFRWQLYTAQQMRSRWTSSILGADMMEESDEEQDTVKETFLETSPYLLGLTVIVSITHSVFEFLAFKNGKLSIFRTYWETHLYLFQQTSSSGRIGGLSKACPWDPSFSTYSSLWLCCFMSWTTTPTLWFEFRLALACSLRSGKSTRLPTLQSIELIRYLASFRELISQTKTLIRRVRLKTSTSWPSSICRGLCSHSWSAIRFIHWSTTNTRATTRGYSTWCMVSFWLLVRRTIGFVNGRVL